MTENRPETPDDRGGDRGALKSLPASIDAERALLGCCLDKPGIAIPLVYDAIGGGDEVFYNPAHFVIWAAIAGRWQNTGAVDLVTLGQDITDAGEIERIGGAAELAELLRNAPPASMAEHYLDIVRDKATRRNIFIQLNRIASHVYDYEIETKDLLDEAEQALFSLREFANREKKKGMRPVAEAMPQVVEELQHAYENRGEVTRGIETGFPSIDLMTLGLPPATVTIIAARPSMGKTSLAMNIVENMALEGKHKVGVFSLEMSINSLLKRIVSARSGVNIYRMRDGFIAADGPQKIDAAAREVVDPGTLFIDDVGDLSIQEMRSRARRAVVKFGLEVLVIDYIQLMKSTSRQAQSSRYVEVGEISRGIRAMAKELDVPVIAVAQLGRKVEERRDKRPVLSDLRESGDIENDADIVGLLYRPGYYKDREKKAEGDEAPDPRFEEPEDNSAVLIFAKQREGPVGDIDLIFDKQTVRFTDPKKRMYN